MNETIKLKSDLRKAELELAAMKHTLEDLKWFLNNRVDAAYGRLTTALESNYYGLIYEYEGSIMAYKNVLKRIGEDVDTSVSIVGTLTLPGDIEVTTTVKRRT